MVYFRGLVWRVGTLPVGGLGMEAHSTEDDIMEESMEGMSIEDRYCIIFFPCKTYSLIVSTAPCTSH